MKIYYKTIDMKSAHCHKIIEIGPYDKAHYDAYNAIYWDYIKNGTIPNMFSEDGKRVLLEYQMHPQDIRIMILQMHKVREWKKQIEKWKVDINEFKNNMRTWEKNMKDWKNKPDANEDNKPPKPLEQIKPYRPPVYPMNIKFETIDEMVASDLYDQINDINFMNCGLHKLPRLPLKLVILNCYHNSLTELPPLPITLKHLDISNNNFVTLSNLPSNLEFLGCSHNQLEHIDQLPLNVSNFYCEYNKLKILPELPPIQECHRGMCYGNFEPHKNEKPCLHHKLTYVICFDNPLEEFPESYTKCIKCGANNLEQWENYSDKIQCKDCHKIITIDYSGSILRKSDWQFNDTPLGKNIHGKFDGSLSAYLTSKNAMNVDGESSCDDDDMVIDYDNIS